MHFLGHMSERRNLTDSVKVLQWCDSPCLCNRRHRRSPVSLQHSDANYVATQYFLCVIESCSWTTRYKGFCPLANRVTRPFGRLDRDIDPRRRHSCRTALAQPCHLCCGPICTAVSRSAWRSVCAPSRPRSKSAKPSRLPAATRRIPHTGDIARTFDAGRWPARSASRPEACVCRRCRPRAHASLSCSPTPVNCHPQASTRPLLWYSIVLFGGRHRGRAAFGGKAMSLQALIILIIVGAIAGWLAGIIVKGVGFGLVGNIIVGIVGALIGTWVLGALGVAIGGSFVRDIINATIGAVILLFIISLVKRA